MNKLIVPNKNKLRIKAKNFKFLRDGSLFWNFGRYRPRPHLSSDREYKLSITKLMLSRAREPY